ncbi:glycosyltransferase family 39 protein [Nocardia sp. 2]|uniref:Glycosyltransferase family 39 protein n=2 Tax=Nocardia acididurans TaxID=2802282 RepID=A0ABS1M0Z1_9NOCA|nr:glycosyltransferase family 39 protein [Nocardia acididurans]
MAWWAVAAVAVPATVVLLLSATRYDYFGDELYFLAAGRRLSFGYADQGPGLPLLARLMDTLAPDSFFALRLPAVGLTVLAIVVCAMLARELGGGRWAQTLAALGYATSPFLLLQGTMLTTNAVDCALWTVIGWCVVRWVRTRDDRLLLAAALLSAVDMQVKWLIPFFWIVLALSAWLIGPRELVRRPLLWAGGVVVVLTTVPQLIWQARHGWPQLEMGRVIAGEQGILGGRVLFVPLSLILAGWLGVLLLVWGLVALLRRESLRPYRFLAVALVLLYLVFMVLGGRVYYPAGLYAPIIAAGAVVLVVTAAGLKPVGRRALLAGTTLVTVLGAAMTLYATPWIPAEDIAPAADGTQAAINIGTYGQFGWPELTDAVTTAYHTLPPQQRAETILITETYWQASALDEFGHPHLPPVYSPSRGFGYFGTPGDDATTVLYIGETGEQEARLRAQFERVEPVGEVNTRLGFPGNTQDVTIWKCTGRTRSWAQVWPTWMHL